MSVFEQLEVIKQNISSIYDPIILLAMNEKYRQLEEEADKIRTIKVIIYNN